MKVAINGFGRIGRQVFKICIRKGIDVVAINDVADAKTLSYLLKYDSIYGVASRDIKSEENSIIIDGKKFLILNEKDPEQLPWKQLGVDVVVESTGLFTSRDGAIKHINAGAKKVLISAPAKNPDITIVPGVNHKSLKPEHNIISVASCTTNCLAPVVKVLHDNFIIKKGFMTTVHAYTSDQRLHDSPHRDLRRARAACESLIPTTTGASKSVAEVIPDLKGKLDGFSIRAPVPCGSIVDFVAELEKPASIQSINESMKKASETYLRGILEYTQESIVSSDIIGNPHSSIFDALSTMMIGDNFVKILSWYDNEYGYSCRMVDVIKMLG
ncbi:MAG: type I glyceraldehyde-3-phosphate dehydrogenase [archaeon]